MPLNVWIVFAHHRRGPLVHGIFTSEMEAASHCPRGWSVALVRLNEMFPEIAIDAEKYYQPHNGPWEKSELYHWQSRAQRIVANFFKSVKHA